MEISHLFAHQSRYRGPSVADRSCLVGGDTIYQAIVLVKVFLIIRMSRQSTEKYLNFKFTSCLAFLRKWAFLRKSDEWIRR